MPEPIETEGTSRITQGLTKIKERGTTKSSAGSSAAEGMDKMLYEVTDEEQDMHQGLISWYTMYSSLEATSEGGPGIS